MLFISSKAQDEFAGTYIRPLDANSHEAIIITETADCYEGQFAEVNDITNNAIRIAVECYMDGEDYFFLVISWEDFEFEISPLQYDNLGQVASFELLAEFPMDEPLIFYRDYQ
jgi:hypothetical protein